MKLEIITKKPGNRYQGDVTSAALAINGTALDINEIERMDFRNSLDGFDGRLFLKDCTLSFKFLSRWSLRKAKRDHLQGFVELRIGSLRKIVKIPVRNMQRGQTITTPCQLGVKVPFFTHATPTAR